MKARKILLPLLAAAMLIVFIYGFNNVFKPDKTAENSKSEPVKTKSNKNKQFKTFSGRQFEDLYNSFAYPNTQQINEETPITGNPLADQKLRELAVDRGYKLRSAPVTDTFAEVQKNMFLQQRAVKPWSDMKKQAAKDSVMLELAAAYRSAKDQKTIFLSRLEGTSVLAIARGEAAQSVNTILERTALPGYSRHHTGYTIDIACQNDLGVKFKASICYKWLSRNNYLNAKKFGWIPSYPPGAGKQGPAPEAWEYVWVGTDTLK